jgi:hypothetical protein
LETVVRFQAQEPDGALHYPASPGD